MAKPQAPTHTFLCHGSIAGRRVEISGFETDSANAIKARAAAQLGCACVAVDDPEPITKKKRQPRGDTLSLDDIASLNIEKGIPVPDKRIRTARWDVLLKKMKEGDSVVLPKREAGSLKAAAKKNDVLILVRGETSEDCRCWHKGKIVAEAPTTPAVSA